MTTETLLVVDDIEMNRDMLSRRLLRKGYRVLQAASGPEALEHIDRDNVDLVLLDIMMPGMTGTEVLRRLRQTYSPQQLPIIMATAKAKSEDMVEALELGANDYVTKPIDFTVALARIRSALRSKKAAPPATSPDPHKHVVTGPETIQRGLLLGGKFELEQEIGSGNFGVVWRAQHRDLGVPVAIKIINAAEQSKNSADRFRVEANSTSRLRHPNAVQVMDFGVSPGGLTFLVMELLEGRTLQDELAMTGPMELVRCAEIAKSICSVLIDAHAIGLIHRDIKPANIFLSRTGTRERVKVVDFGIAKLVGDPEARQDLTQEGSIVGSPTYMSPERLMNRDTDGSADVYSLGVVLYEMVAGRPPYQSPEPLSLAMMHINDEPPALREHRKVPAALEQLVMATLDKEPGRRPTAEAVMARLDQALVERPKRRWLWFLGR